MNTRESKMEQAKQNASETAAHEKKPDISNLQMCIEDAKRAGLDGDTGPADPTGYDRLRGRLEACREKLSPLYRDVV